MPACRRKGTVMEAVAVRVASPADAAAISEIYSYYVLHTAVTFEWEAPGVEEMRGRIARTLEKYPWLVALRDGRIVGYAYAGPFKDRAAYDWCAELSIYLAPEFRGQGVGSVLYEALEAALGKMGVSNLYACIAVPEREDAFLTRSSERFHSRRGYRTVGEFKNCGYKFGRWYHMIWMEKIIGEHPAVLPPLRSFPEIVL